MSPGEVCISASKLEKKSWTGLGQSGGAEDQTKHPRLRRCRHCTTTTCPLTGSTPPCHPLITSRSLTPQPPLRVGHTTPDTESAVRRITCYRFLHYPSPSTAQLCTCSCSNNDNKLRGQLSCSTLWSASHQTRRIRKVRIPAHSLRFGSK